MAQITEFHDVIDLDEWNLGTQTEFEKALKSILFYGNISMKIGGVVRYLSVNTCGIEINDVIKTAVESKRYEYTAVFYSENEIYGLADEITHYKGSIVF